MSYKQHDEYFLALIYSKRSGHQHFERALENEEYFSAQTKKGRCHRKDKKLNHNFIVKKWLPGLLTNLNSFKENLKTLNNMLEQKESDSYQKLNNKAKITFDKKLKNLSDLYEGIRNLSVLPDIMILCDPSVEINPYKEAQMLGIRTWAIGDTSSDPSGFEIFVSCNDDGKKSLRLIFDTIEKNI